MDNVKELNLIAKCYYNHRESITLIVINTGKQSDIFYLSNLLFFFFFCSFRNKEILTLHGPQTGNAYIQLLPAHGKCIFIQMQCINCSQHWHNIVTTFPCLPLRLLIVPCECCELVMFRAGGRVGVCFKMNLLVSQTKDVTWILLIPLRFFY